MTGIYTWLTPPAPAAIAVVAVPVMPGLIDRAWPEPGRARFARLVNAAGTVVDEVLADRVDASTIWLMPHGGPGIRQAVTDCLEGHGLAPGAGTLDVTWRDLAAAAHPAAVTWLLAGETPPFPREFLFRQPVVLITGPANAGKSTLLNAWCGHGRALVSPQAGTTRDLVTATVLVHGWRLRLTDSAGLRATADPLEQAGQDLVAWARQRADVVLHLCPPEGGTVPLPGDLVVRGKADVPGAPLGAPSASSARDNQHVELENPGISRGPTWDCPDVHPRTCSTIWAGRSLPDCSCRLRAADPATAPAPGHRVVVGYAGLAVGGSGLGFGEFHPGIGQTTGAGAWPGSDSSGHGGAPVA